MSDTSGVFRPVKKRKAIPLDGLTEAADLVDGVRRRDLDPGDRVIISTKNSVYSLTARADGSFDVSGGWFEREGEGQTRVEVRGCTAGGHAIFTDHIAAKGSSWSSPMGCGRPGSRACGGSRFRRRGI